MTYQELQDILRRNQLGQGVPVAPSLDQIISGIQSQYQPQFMPVEYSQPRFVQEYSAPEQFSFQQPSFNYQPPSQLMPTTMSNAGAYNLLPTGGQFGGQGAQRFATGPQTFEQAAFAPVASSAPVFTPGSFDIEQFRYKEPEVVAPPVVESSGGGDGGNSGISVDDAGLATASNVSPNAAGALATVLGMLTGLPLGALSNVVGKKNIADAINQQSYNAAVAYNNALVAEQSGLANTPENSAALASLIDSLSSSPVGQPVATVGPSGTGGSAAQAAQEAAAAAAALGMSDAAIGAASQAAASAAIQGATPAEQAQAAQMAAANTDAAGMGANAYGSSPNAVGAPTADQAAQQAADFVASLGVPTSFAMTPSLISPNFGYFDMTNGLANLAASLAAIPDYIAISNPAAISQPSESYSGGFDYGSSNTAVGAPTAEQAAQQAAALAEALAAISVSTEPIGGSYDYGGYSDYSGGYGGVDSGGYSGDGAGGYY